ncbi:MAG: MarR family transcriptional regulator [Deltaproteobacteria bacterium]|nr:MarR family transcriptional regulator [Deltaproteobacteria bacterium]
MIPDRLNDCLYYLVTRASLTTTGALRRRLVDAGLEAVRPAYLGVLLCLWQQDDAKTAELGRRAGLEPSTMTGLLDRMERDGLVQRHADPEDRRAQRIKLSERGRKAKGEVMKVVDATLDRVTSGFTKAELAELQRLLQRLIAAAREGEEAGR